MQPFIRHTGPALSPFNAWVLVKSLETLDLRVKAQTASAARLAGHLEGVAGVRSVWYPFLESHPQHSLARSQMAGGGSVVTFEIDGGKDEAFAVLNALEVIDISNNLGDSKSLVTHPASTTHRRLGPEVRATMGITDGVIRISVGLENTDDLIADVDHALESR